MPLWDKLPENGTVWRGLSRNFLLRKALYAVELISTFPNGLQQLATPLHGVSPHQQRFSKFYDSFNKGACTHFSFFIQRSIARQVAGKIVQSVTGPKHQTLLIILVIFFLTEVFLSWGLFFTI